MPFTLDVYDPLPVQKLPPRAEAADVLISLQGHMIWENHIIVINMSSIFSVFFISYSDFESWLLLPPKRRTGMQKCLVSLRRSPVRWPPRLCARRRCHLCQRLVEPPHQGLRTAGECLVFLTATEMKPLFQFCHDFQLFPQYLFWRRGRLQSLLRLCVCKKKRCSLDVYSTSCFLFLRKATETGAFFSVQISEVSHKLGPILQRRCFLSKVKLFGLL